MFEDIFLHKKLNISKLKNFGFADNGGSYEWHEEIMDNAFTLHITFGADGLPDTRLIENETGEEYVLYKTSAEGSYVGAVRSEVESALRQIAEHCCDAAVFKSGQAQALIEYVREAYGDELEFLWEKFSDNAVWRRKDSGKWYAVLLTVSKSKLGFESDERVEIIDLRIQPGLMPELLKKEHYFPGWHMNKKSWYTIILDGTVPDEELFRRIQESYDLAKK